MKKHIVILFMFLAFVAEANCQSTDSTVLYGRILNESNAPIRFAHIAIKNSIKGTISDLHGHFEIQLNQNDKLLVSCIGYKSKIISFPEIIQGEVFKTIYLNKDTIELAEATIRPWPATYGKLKERVVNMDFEDKYTFQTQDKFLNKEMLTAKKLALRNTGSEPLTISGPFSLVYNTFGNKPRQLRQLPRQKAQAQKEQIIKNKFNLEIIKRVTKMNNQDSIKDFLDYCNYDEDYLVAVNEYELILDIKKKFNEYILGLNSE